jgi:hypothetical protein
VEHSPNRSRGSSVNHQDRGSTPGTGQTPRGSDGSSHEAHSPAEQRAREQATELVIAAANLGLLEAVAERAVDYTDERVWRLLRKKWRPHRCRQLAKLARAILDGKKKLHQLVGTATDKVLERIGAEPIERLFARKLVEGIPIPSVDTKAIAAARALQLVGMCLCLMQDELPRCACLADLVQNEAKDRLTKLLEMAAGDWVELGQIQPKERESEDSRQVIDLPYPRLHLPPSSSS